MQLTREDVHRMLTENKIVASVGVSSNSMKDSYWIVHYLQFQGYTVYPVNPGADEILGVKSYSDLASLPEKPDIVQIFRKPEAVPAVVDAAIEAGAKVVWMQEGVAHEGAAEKALAAGLEVVMNLCMRSAHQFLIGDKKGWANSVMGDERYRAFVNNF